MSGSLGEGLRRAVWGGRGVRLACAALLTVAIARQATHQAVLGSVSPDMGQQLAAAQALVDGGGLAIAQLSGEEGPLEVMRGALWGWPPGFSLAVAAVLRWTGDPWQALAVLDLVSIALCFGAWFAVLERLGPRIGPVSRLVFWALWAFGWTPLHAMASPDILGQALFAAAVAASLASPATRPVLAGVGSGLLAGAAAVVRFAYGPLVVVPGLALGLVSRGRRSSGSLDGSASAGATLGLRRTAAASLVAAAAVGASVLAYQKLDTGAATYLFVKYGPEVGGLHPENLARVCPFPLHLLGVPQFLARRGGAMPAGAAWSPLLTWAIAAAILLLALAPLVRRWREAGSAAEAPRALEMRVLLTEGALATGLTIGMLATLSLLVPIHSYGWAADGVWTYVEESRYFAAFFPFLGLGWACAIGDLLASPARGDGSSRRLARAAGAGLLLASLWIGASAGSGDLVRELATGGADAAPWSIRRRDDRAVYGLVRALRAEGREVLILRERPADEIAAFVRSPVLAGVWKTGLVAGAASVPAERMARSPLACERCAILVAMADRSPEQATPAAAAALARDGRFRAVLRVEGGSVYALAP